jgi:hypothetical protein
MSIFWCDAILGPPPFWTLSSCQVNTIEEIKYNTRPTLGCRAGRMLQQLVRTAAQASHPHHATDYHVAQCSSSVALWPEAHIFSGSTCLILTCMLMAIFALAGVAGLVGRHWSMQCKQ